MEQVKEGDVVRVHYTGKLTNGEQFDSSEGRQPLEFTVGAGQMIKGFDAAMPGMSVGEKKTINIAPEDAYGQKDEHAIIEFPRENVPRVFDNYTANVNKFINLRHYLDPFLNKKGDGGW